MFVKGKVSICIPTYNRPLLIKMIIDSILIQTYQNFEIIIADNSENMETANLVSKFDDVRIKYMKNHRNIGIGGNTKKVFSFVSGEYFSFTPDDDLWIDKTKLEQQIDFLESYRDINIVYGNAESINYEGQPLNQFDSIYKEKSYDILHAEELLPGYNTKYFLMIATALLRSNKLLKIFKESFSLNSEEYLCYYIASVERKIGFIYKKMVALREAEHFRTALVDGKIIDVSRRSDVRIKQVVNIYNSLIVFHPETVSKLNTIQVNNYLARHILSQAKVSKNLVLVLKTLAYVYLTFEKFSWRGILSNKCEKKKSFG